MRTFRKWIALPRRERQFFLRLVLLMPAVWVSLRMVGLVRMIRWAESVPDARHVDQSVSPNQPETLALLARYGALSRAAARIGIIKASCLVQSLALCHTLNRMGFTSKVRLGVKSISSPFIAHAWVECRGVPVGETVVDYVPFPEPLPGNRVE